MSLPRTRIVEPFIVFPTLALAVGAVLSMERLLVILLAVVALVNVVLALVAEKDATNWWELYKAWCDDEGPCVFVSPPDVWRLSRVLPDEPVAEIHYPGQPEAAGRRSAEPQPATSTADQVGVSSPAQAEPTAPSAVPPSKRCPNGLA